MRTEKNRGRTSFWCFLIVMVFLTAIWFAGFSENTEEPSQYEGDTQKQTMIFQGKRYRKNPNIQVLLLLGIDQEEELNITWNRGENGQSDSIILFIFDTKKEEAKILPVSRDTITDIDIYDIRGEKYITEKGQIALQYAYGDGKEFSCLLVADKVSKLLLDVEVDNYFAVRMGGIQMAVDAVGGLKVTLEDEDLEADKTFKKGAKLILNGKMAESFLRARSTKDPLGNSRRMKRQILFLKAFSEKLKAYDSIEKIKTMYDVINPYVCTNLTAADLKRINGYEISKEQLEIPGNLVEEDGYARFYPDEEKIRELVVHLFYKEVKAEAKNR